MAQPPPTAPILDFVLAHARVRANVCTRQKFETGYTLAPRTVPDHNFIYVTRGRVVWVVESVEHVLTPGDLVIVPPGVPHHGFSRTRRVTLGSVHVEVTLPGGQDVFELLGPPRQQRFARGSRFDAYFRAAMEEFDRDEASHTMHLMPAWARLLVLELFIDNARRSLLRPQPLDGVVAAVLEELHRRDREDVSLTRLAAWSGFTPQHLNRRFREVLGVTPLQYHTRLRLERSAALLAEGTLTVRAVAERHGFTDPYYYSRLFRQHFGQSPAQYSDAAGSDSPSPGSARPFTAPRRRG